MRALTCIGVLVLAATAMATGQQTFEVASVKPSAPGAGTGWSVVNQPGGRFVARNAPLIQVIVSAFAVRDFQIVDAPAWVRSERFDIAATTDPKLTFAEMRPLMRALLAERFHLVTRPDKREMENYALVMARPDKRLGPKLRPTSVEDCANEARRAELLAAGRLACGTRSPTAGQLNGTGVPLAMLANALVSRLNMVVTDQTGLTGRYDFDLEWSAEVSQSLSVGVPDAPAGSGASLFTAIQEQLGMRLQSQRTPIDVIVIERIERPTPD